MEYIGDFFIRGINVVHYYKTCKRDDTRQPTKRGTGKVRPAEHNMA